MTNDKVVSLGGHRGTNKRGHERKKHPSSHSNSASEIVYCSFCGRPNTEVIKMVKGPGVNICSECTMIAVQYLILEDKMPSAEAQQILDSLWGHADPDTFA